MPVSVHEQRRQAAMRVLYQEVLWHREQARFLQPRLNEIALGSADFDHILKAVVREAYLEVIRKRGTPAEAHVAAIADGNYCVEQWNQKGHKTRASVNGPWELKRWEKMGESEADSVHRHYLNLLRV